ncbi:recombinase family protein [Pseudogracilibacillus sp. SE30717A]|uniref:recombinase family protein n=1 Tax=Pseudogracilibacillus sp. SE30717A TaxID=3098293 RepID=UPI00300E548A
MKRIYGYIRVSSVDQNEDRQRDAMQAKGVEDRFLYVDKVSGKDFERPDYQQLRRAIRQGDLVYMDALDRLGRNYDEVIKEWKYITREVGADIVLLENEELFDSRKFREMGDVGRLMEDQFLSLLSYVADQERKKIRRRQAEGIASAKRRGKHIGRPRIAYDTLDEGQRASFLREYKRWKADEQTAVQSFNNAGFTKSTWYKIVKEYEEVNKI